MRNRRELTPSEYNQKVRSWLQDAKRRGSTHVIVAFDVQKRNPFPVYVSSDQNVQQKIKGFNDNQFCNAVEVYNLKLDIDTQIQQGRAWNA
jgi:hypothetical protein